MSMDPKYYYLDLTRFDLTNSSTSERSCILFILQILLRSDTNYNN